MQTLRIADQSPSVSSKKSAHSKRNVAVTADLVASSGVDATANNFANGNGVVVTQEDQDWGFSFGIDGCLSTEQACRFLGDIHRTTAERWAREGSIRKRSHGERKSMYCLRSLRVFLRKLPRDVPAEV